MDLETNLSGKKKDSITNLTLLVTVLDGRAPSLKQVKLSSKNSKLHTIKGQKHRLQSDQYLVRLSGKDRPIYLPENTVESLGKTPF
jgi:hypothetical protein